LIFIAPLAASITSVSNKLTVAPTNVGVRSGSPIVTYELAKKNILDYDNFLDCNTIIVSKSKTQKEYIQGYN